MRIRNLAVPIALVLASCSETPVEEQGDEAIAEMETRIQEDAQSLEEAADEAVKVLAEDIDAELAADGFVEPAAEAKPDGTGN